MSQQFQLDPELTLEKAKMRIRQREAVGQQQKAVKAPPIANVADIEQLHSRRRLTQSNKGHRRATQNRGDRSGKPKDIRREWIRLIVQTRTLHGAEVIAISEDAYKTIQSQQILPSTKILYGPSRQLTPLHWTVSREIQSQRQSSNTTSVCRQRAKVKSPGLPAITALRLVTRLNTTKVTEDYQKQFPSLFEGLGNLGEPFEIHLKEGAVPPTASTL